MTRLFSFRERHPVRFAALGALTWMARCPYSKRWIDNYDKDNLKFYTEFVKACSRACKVDRWLLDSIEQPEYAQETGYCLGEGGVCGPGRAPKL